MRIRGVEQRENWRRVRSEENLKRMEEEMICDEQQVEIRGLEVLLRRSMYRDRFKWEKIK